MIISLVCENEPCSGDVFRIEVDKCKLTMICSKCESIRLNKDFKNKTIKPQCEKCGCDTFKMKYNFENDSIEMFCSNCGAYPGFLDTDDEGNLFIDPVDKRLYLINKKLDEILKEQEYIYNHLRELEGINEGLYYVVKSIRD